MLFRDRLEVLSPGGLPEGMTEEKMTKTHQSYPVNPTLAYPVYLAGYIEHLGTGTIDLIDKCREKGLKTPEFHFDEDGQVIIWRKNVTPDVTPVDAEIQSVDKGDAQNVTPDVTPDKVALRVKNILTELMSNRYITTEELAAKFKVSSRTITRNINSLRETYTIIWIPLSNTKGYWTVERK